jgi:transcriptional regulator with XRE-family HTH domain
MTNRFKLLLEKLNVTPSEFADRIGVQRSSVSHVLSGRNKPSIDFLEKILMAFPEIDAGWLITGRAFSDIDLSKEAHETANELFIDKNIESGHFTKENPQGPSEQEPVDHVIIVYKNNTFRILNHQ